ncbi:HtrA2 peptidase [Stanieria cyanosphaera PCC 7437]|uniref:HtrA2 peptidase n=1 Tax=Stanieria cyanosphaera (strain ATCC 29371 / PCC 7437) TaxID=111780 RepID=K9XV51_STAC7|nr:HhoA/HhoB/HtrA family serine endopeptidase [Stanieria cyanosphaera]AFZ35542.1 HtrA2 peptidase [Stanieria cyanosphaera PCC 7437]
MSIAPKYFIADRKNWHRHLIIYLLTIIISLGLVILNPPTAKAESASSKQLESIKEVTPEIILDQNSIPSPTQQANFVTTVSKAVEPAVVQVNVSRALDGVFLPPFFGRQPGNLPSQPTLRGLGSGFVIDPNGLILTNAHVVNQADEVTVSFQDGRLLNGEVLGKDPVTDIAVVKVEATDLPTVKIGDSDRVEQGQWAIAIGNPLGLQETVTVGVISATHRFSRDIGIADKRIGFLQTDAAINPGNSGGPLLNAQGEVIGVNTAIIGGTQGLGFAIPINTAQNIAQQLISTGKVEHPYIGIEMVALTPEIKHRLNQIPNRKQRVNQDHGLLIVTVQPDSPASAARLHVGDVIVGIDGQSITKADTLQQLLDRNGVGHKMQLELDREGKNVAIAVIPQSLPLDPAYPR